jgi:Domain of unknown function (DUF4136)
MKRMLWLCVVAALAAAAPLVAQTPKYGVTVKADEKTDFAKFKTYKWEHGWQAYDKRVHQAILAAVDRELAAVGLTKKTSGPADLLVTYGSLRRVDIDPNSEPTAAGTRPQYDVGTLVVLLLEPASRKELFRARVDTPIELDSATVAPIVDSTVTEMFAKYPTKIKK